jgi:cytoskeletal protein CcmA (bactofilin family)
MLGSSKAKPAIGGQTLLNLIGSGTVIKGNIVCNGDIRIDGQVDGNVEVGQKLVIGESGKVNGNIIAGDINVSGEVLGNITADKTTVLHGKSTVTGDISTLQIIIEQGAQFNGKCTMGDSLKLNNSHGSANSKSV